MDSSRVDAPCFRLGHSKDRLLMPSDPLLVRARLAQIFDELQIQYVNAQFPSDENWELRIEHWSDLVFIFSAYVTVILKCSTKLGFDPMHDGPAAAHRRSMRAQRGIVTNPT